jgi:hypothetical protein
MKRRLGKIDADEAARALMAAEDRCVRRYEHDPRQEAACAAGVRDVIRRLTGGFGISGRKGRRR